LPTGLGEPEPLQASHDISGFDCGHIALNDWLREKALRPDARTSRCYVVARDNAVVAYYSLAAGAVTHEDAPGKLRRNAPDTIPVMMIGRLAVDRTLHGKGLGRGLLKDALLRVARASEVIGARAVIVHAVDQAALSFYLRYGFRSFPAEPLTLFRPIDEIVASL